MVNTFFQINIKGEGYKFIWLLQDNKNLNLLKFIPNLKEYVIGVSLGFVFYKTDNYIFYINLCRLGIKDEYGRYGVLFNQGGFVECTKLNMNLVLEILNHVLSIRENLKNDYNRIVYNLQQIADSEKKFNFDILNEIALIRDYNLQFIFDKYNLSAFNRIIENKNINFVTPFEENIDYTLCRILYNFLKKEMNFNLASGELISFSDFKYSIN